MKRVSGIGLVALVAVLGCAGFASDSVWMQQISVPTGTANFQQCVSAAVADVHSVSIDRASGSTEMVALDVKLAKPIPFLDAEVQHRGHNSATVMFTGRGDSEPEGDRKVLTPVLQSVADAISKHCGTGPQKK
jgi:hypothetical protein